ncbi:MAG: NAD(P)-dependent glycerol-3-phosphate dehydrogenase [Mailhella sp.]|nr:NAD(P)-dependent glycerol-3-phosphate dehydrogenase [Mailhella sp.]
MQIAILGSGTWGTALAAALSSAGHGIRVWSHEKDKASLLSSARRHPKFQDVALPESIMFTSDAGKAVSGAEHVIFAVSSPHVRMTARIFAPLLDKKAILISAAKGIERDTLLMMTEVIDEETRRLRPDRKFRTVALTGPTHAEEVIIGMPTSALCACEDLKTAEKVQGLFRGTCVRPYVHKDIRGAELCGALKNIIALAVGMASGLGYGDNTKAALITRGMAEITRLGLKMGCDQRTFAGLAGIGDLIVTATSEHSRNNRAGKLIGQGVPPLEAIARIGMAVEGFNTLPAAMKLARRYDVEMPITETVNAIMQGTLSTAVAVAGLMNRAYKNENG